MQTAIDKLSTSFCPDRETLKIRLRADVNVYLDAVTELQRGPENERSFKLAERARLAYEASRQRFDEHVASHGCA